MNKHLLIWVGFLILLMFSCQKEDALVTEEDQKVQRYREELLLNEDFLGFQNGLEKQYEEEYAALEDLNSYIGRASSRIKNVDEPFVFFVIGDTELDLRGNTFEQLETLLEAINNVEDLNISFPNGDFDEDETDQILKPELLFLAGDINRDRSFGFFSDNKAPTNRLFKTLDEDILFFPGNGNHDWDPFQFGDGSYGLNLDGLISNLGTASFVRRNYQSSLNKACCISDPTFNYDRNSTFFPLTSTAEFNYSFEYKGLQFTNLNTFLQNPVSMMSLESLFNAGPAWYFENETKPWLAKICEESRNDEKQHVLIQHYPINSFSASQWWTDYGVSSTENLRREFLDIFSESHDPIMFSGHNHSFSTTNVLPYELMDHTSGYFAQQNAVIAVKASASKGIYAMAYIDIINGTVRDPYENVRNFTVQ